MKSFEHDIRFEVKKFLPKYDGRAQELGKLEPFDLLLMLMNYRSHLIHPHARNAFISKEVCNRRDLGEALFDGCRHEVDRLIEMICIGKDLNDLVGGGFNCKPYQLTPNFRKLSKEKHLDLLLNEQGIHHLHLPGMRKRKGSPIIFIVFERKYAFILDIARHDDWNSDRLARISVKNWPERHYVKMKVDRLCLSDDTRVDVKDEERVSIRNNAINMPIKIEDGHFVMPRARGLASNGYSNRVVEKGRRIWNSLCLFEKRQGRSDFPEYFALRTNRAFPSNASFKFRLIDTMDTCDFGIVEEQTGLTFRLPDAFD